MPRAANAIVISTGDLNAALNWASQGAFADASTSFKLFKDDRQTVVDDVRQQSADIANNVDDAIADVLDVVDDQPPPAQSTYLPVFQRLAQVVEDANTQLGLIAPTTNALRISTTDLVQSVTWASQGNLAKTHDEFDQFRDDWSLVRDAVRQQLPGQADNVDTATTAVQAIVSNSSNDSVGLVLSTAHWELMAGYLQPFVVTQDPNAAGFRSSRIRVYTRTNTSCTRSSTSWRGTRPSTIACTIRT